MKLLFLPSALLVLLASCGPNKHVNAWDRQSSALDPVGITSKKMAAKNKAEQAFYKPGEAVTFKKDRMMVFEQNPESNFSTSGCNVAMLCRKIIKHCGKTPLNVCPLHPHCNLVAPPLKTA